MKVYLMYPDRDFDPQQALPAQAEALIQDLELDTLFEAMAAGNKFLGEIARKAVLIGLREPAEIEYRQAILRDCLKNPTLVRALYQLPITAAEYKRQRWLGIFSRYPIGILSSAREMLQMFLDLLQVLSHMAVEHAERFESAGFRRFFAMIREELDADFFARAREHLETLQFRDGVLLSAKLGQGNEGTEYVLHRPAKKRGWWPSILTSQPPVYSFSIHPRDEHGARAISEIRDRGVNLVANALAQSADHIDSFFRMLQNELAFYVGCLNLAERLTELGAPFTFPLPLPLEERRHRFTGLYDVCLALTMQKQVVGNEVDADGKELVFITGANQGGKSTFLRSIGLAQLLMQAGMFVPAETFAANVCQQIFTHYKREEDATMTSGKLDEELHRMSEIVTQLVPHSLVLFNESFAATNEREGSEIGRQIVSALLERRIKVFFVTHLYELARSFYAQDTGRALFLRAERQEDGTRTFKLHVGKPLPTSFGVDLYQEVFESSG